MTEFLEGLGIDVELEAGEVEHVDGWATVGILVIEASGRVRVIPHHGLTPRQRTTLLAIGDRVWSSGRGCLGGDTGWQYDPEVGWVAGVRVRQRPEVLDVAELTEWAAGLEAER